jgi:hypothetical protein
VRRAQVDACTRRTDFGPFRGRQAAFKQSQYPGTRPDPEHLRAAMFEAGTSWCRGLSLAQTVRKEPVHQVTRGSREGSSTRLHPSPRRLLCAPRYSPAWRSPWQARDDSARGHPVCQPGGSERALRGGGPFRGLSDTRLRQHSHPAGGVSIGRPRLRMGDSPFLNFRVCPRA